MDKRLTKLIISIIGLNCLLFASGSYEFLLFPQDARSLSLNNTTSANDGPFLQNNPAAFSMHSKGITYSYFYLPANIHFGGIQRVSKSNEGILASKLSFLSYGEIVDSEAGGKTYPFDVMVEIGYKREIKNITSLGISGGYMLSSIAGFHSQLLFSNWGLRSRLMKKRLGVGLSLENIGILLKSYTDVGETIPLLFRTSFYYKPIYIPLIINGDVVRQLDVDSFYFLIGLEFKPDNRLIIRLGCKADERIKKFKDFTSDFITTMSGGFGFRFTNMTLDVGFMNIAPAEFIIGFSLTKKLD